MSSFGRKTGKAVQAASYTIVAPFELYTAIEKALCVFTVPRQANSQVTPGVTLGISGITAGCFL